jgi:uncharacterized protein (DUF2164 family)
VKKGENMERIYRIVITCLSIILVFYLIGCRTSKKTGFLQEKTKNITVVNFVELSGKTGDEVEKILGKHTSEIATSELVSFASKTMGNYFLNKGYKINASGNLLLNRGYKTKGKAMTVFFADDIVSGWSI